jgi:hypothetical protein
MEAQRPLAIRCPAYWRGAEQQAQMGIVGRALIISAGPRSSETDNRSPSPCRLTDTAITLLYPCILTAAVRGATRNQVRMEKRPFHLVYLWRLPL